MVLYGIAAALFAYCISLAVNSPLAAFATVAGYQFIVFVVRSLGLPLPLGLGAHFFLALPLRIPPGSHLRQNVRGQ
jgi:hypothetical protein